MKRNVRVIVNDDMFRAKFGHKPTRDSIDRIVSAALGEAGTVQATASRGSGSSAASRIRKAVRRR